MTRGSEPNECNWKIYENPTTKKEESSICVGPIQEILGEYGLIHDVYHEGLSGPVTLRNSRYRYGVACGERKGQCCLLSHVDAGGPDAW